MPAITGDYRPADKVLRHWASKWIHPPLAWSGVERSVLWMQLRHIHRWLGPHEAREYRNYLLWLGVYPSRVRSHQVGATT